MYLAAEYALNCRCVAHLYWRTRIYSVASAAIRI